MGLYTQSSFNFLVIVQCSNTKTFWWGNIHWLSLSLCRQYYTNSSYTYLFICYFLKNRMNDCCRCPAGKRLFQGSTWCENVDECSENPSLCYYGTCRDTDDGYTCDCDDGYFGPTCRERRGAVTVVISTEAQLAITACALILLSELLFWTFVEFASLHIFHAILIEFLECQARKFRWQLVCMLSGSCVTLICKKEINITD